METGVGVHQCTEPLLNKALRLRAEVMTRVCLYSTRSQVSPVAGLPPPPPLNLTERPLEIRPHNRKREARGSRKQVSESSLLTITPTEMVRARQTDMR
ncbi:hypothetical protein C0Q70_15700 [Pomacea canaliculata]|uniref:Uncharacterized protein n=1 Tax=Pomacea canaliculata TaxID=400727 RepID=A0A2T7NVK8_POMCA|nr:hypothetical protein C0Q70_15700 [Pomacea canaliculata]